MRTASIFALGVLFLHPTKALPIVAQEPEGVFIESKEDDASWLPRGNIQNEGQRGERYRLEVYWNHSSFGDSTKTKITVELQNVSAWKGIAGNFGTNPNPDLRIEAELNAKWDVAPGGQSATTKEEIAK